MNIYLCDDEEKILQDIIDVVKKCSPDSEIYSFTKATELVPELEKEEADILLLDIDMPDMNGLDVARKISECKKRPMLIFVTSHDELVYESFKYHPFGFVRKRFFREELPKMLLDCKEEWEREKKNFCFRADGKDIRILMADIVFMESDANYIKVYTKEGEYRFRSTMTAMENSLQPHGFIRIHKGFLVNQDKVLMIGPDEIKLMDGRKLPVGKTYFDSAKKQLMRYL